MSISTMVLFSLIAGEAVLLLGVGRLLWLLLDKLSNFFAGGAWLAPLGLLLLVVVLPFARYTPTGQILWSVFFLPAAGALTFGFWHWLPPIWKDLAAEKKLFGRTMEKKPRKMLQMDAVFGSLKAVLDVTTTASFTADKDGKILTFTPEAAQLFGLEVSKAKDYLFTALLGAESATQAGVVWRDLTAEARQRSGTWMRLTGAHKNGAKFPFEAFAMKCEDHFVILVRSLHELQRLQKELEKMQKEIKRLEEDLDVAEKLKEVAQEMLTSVLLKKGQAQTMMSVAATPVVSRQATPIGKPAAVAPVQLQPRQLTLLRALADELPLPNDTEAQGQPGAAVLTTFRVEGALHVDMLGRPTRHRRDGGMQLVLLQYSGNLALSVQPMAMQWPVRTAVPLASLKG